MRDRDYLPNYYITVVFATGSPRIDFDRANMNKTALIFLLFGFVFREAAVAQDAALRREFEFFTHLGATSKYELYWSFNDSSSKISFAVRVQTTGWVGFGVSPFGRDCRLKYNFNFEDMSVAFSDSPTFCDQYDTFSIQIRSVEAELQAREDW